MSHYPYRTEPQNLIFQISKQLCCLSLAIAVTLHGIRQQYSDLKSTSPSCARDKSLLQKQSLSRLVLKNLM